MKSGLECVTMAKWKVFINKKGNAGYIIVTIFIISVVIRTVLGVAFGQMNVFFDELLHWNLSKSVYYHLGSLFRNDMLNYNEMLYSVVISVSHFFGNTEMQYFIAVGINSILMSSVVFPVYAMSESFLGSRYQAVILSFVSIMLPEMAYTAKIIQENLYYPMTIWFFYLFIFLILRNPYRKRNMVFLGSYVFAVSLCKQMALNIFTGVVLYYLLQFLFFDKENRKKCAVCLLWFTAVFGSLKMLYGVLFNLANGLATESSSEVTIGVILGNLLDPYLISQLIYPAVTYLLLSVMFSGLFTVILPLSLVKELSVKERNLLLIIGTIFTSTVMVICLRIIPAENLDVVKIRFHFRYLFYLVVPLLILFLSMKDRLAGGKYLKRAALLSLLYILLLSHISILPEEGSKIDCAGANYIKYLFESEMMQNTLRILIIIVMSFCLYLLHRKKIKLFYSVILAGFVVSGIVNNCYTYSEFYENKQQSVSKKEDAFTINSYFHDIINKEDNSLLIISETKYSEGKLEVYLQHPDYYLCKMEDFKEFADGYSGGSFAGLTMNSFNIEFRDEELNCPEYIISYEPIRLEGYKETDIALNRYHMYERK